MSHYSRPIIHAPLFTPHYSRPIIHAPLFTPHYSRPLIPARRGKAMEQEGLQMRSRWTKTRIASFACMLTLTLAAAVAVVYCDYIHKRREAVRTLEQLGVLVVWDYQYQGYGESMDSAVTDEEPRTPAWLRPLGVDLM